MKIYLNIQIYQYIKIVKMNNLSVNGVSGLNNIGNTCYMNSALQCLSASDLLVGFLVKKKFVSDLKNNILEELAEKERKRKKKAGEEVEDDDISVYLKDVKRKYYHSMTYNSYKLFKTMWKGNNKITPKTFKDRIGESCSTFRGFSQQDSEEFINFLLDKIHEENKSDVIIKYNNIPEDILKYIETRKKILEDIKEENSENIDKKVEEFSEYKKKYPKEEIIYKSLEFWDSHVKNNYSIITDIFTGLYMNEIKCTKCSTKNVRFETFNILPLSIQNETCELKDCLKDFSSFESLSGENKYQCETCKELTDAEKRVFLWELPELLVIQLKRFNNNGRFVRKNNSTVKFPIKDLTFEENYHEYRVRNYKYNLYGIVYHMGSLSGGHYISYTKNPFNNEWYKYNDSNAYHIPEEQIEKEIMDGGTYILFYKKVNYKSSEKSADEETDIGFTSDDDV